MSGAIITGMPTMIWSLACLSDSTIVSGDNKGSIQIWDGVTGVLLSSTNQHSGDVLCIEASEDETYIFASGVDSKVVCLKRVPVDISMNEDNNYANRGLLSHMNSSSYSNPSAYEWLFVNAMRPHSHDIYALAVCRATQYPPQPQPQQLVCDVDSYNRRHFSKRKRGIIDSDNNNGISSSSSSKNRERARTNSVDGTTSQARLYQCLYRYVVTAVVTAV